MSKIGVEFTSAISVGIRINTNEKLCEEEITYILEKVSYFSILNDATNTVSYFHKKAGGMRRTNSTVLFKAVNSSGLPISLDWGYSEKLPVCIDEYEGNKNSRRNSSRVLNKFNRETFLRETLGYTEEVINNAKKKQTT